MKRRDLLSALLDAILAAVIAIAGVGCLISGLSLDTNMSAVVLTALAFGLLTAVLCRLPVSWIWILLTLALGAQTLWVLEFGDFFFPQLKAVLTIYHKVYGWGVPKWLEAYKPCSATMTACVITAGVSMVAGISLKINQYPGALLALLLPVIPCIVVTDTPPDGLYLWLGFVCIGVLTLTWNSRRIDTRQANRLTAMVLVPVMLANILLFSRNPQSEYDAPDREDGIFQQISSLIDRLPFMNMIPEGSNPIQMVSSPQDVDLSVLGPNNHPAEAVMEIRASFDGPIYLRGRSYDLYSGTGWYVSDGKETMTIPTTEYLKSSKQALQIHTYAVHAQQYFPYYLSTPPALKQGMVANDGGVDVVCTVLPLRSDWMFLWDDNFNYLYISDMRELSSQAGFYQYLELPRYPYQYAQYHLKQAGVSGNYQSVLDVVEKIRDYVRESAEYDLNTGCMPADEADFAMWFLESSKTGYCVHYATAATVLLRAAGIPARYVEGYLAEAKKGENVVITSASAHAWVEYYLPDVGWVVLEATPGDGLPVTLPEEPTIPPDTYPTLPTAPSAPTMPTLPTAPTEPTEPTEPTTEPTEPTPPETTAPTEPTQPSTSTGPATTPTEPTIPPDTPAEPRDWSGLLKVLRWIALGLAILAVVIGQRWLRMWLRRKKMRGSAWPQVRARWLYACRLAKMCGYESPAALEALAKKARFSQHTLSDKELRQFDLYTDACIRILQRKPWPIRMVYRLVLAIW